MRDDSLLRVWAFGIVWALPIVLVTWWAAGPDAAWKVGVLTVAGGVVTVIALRHLDRQFESRDKRLEDLRRRLDALERRPPP